MRSCREGVEEVNHDRGKGTAEFIWDKKIQEKTASEKSGTVRKFFLVKDSGGQISDLRANRACGSQ